jgi:hypothetical protein
MTALISFVAVLHAYLLGWVAAATTGALFALSTLLIVRPAWLYSIAAGVGAACSYWLTDFNNPNLIPDPEFIAVSGAFAALVCARIAHPFHLGRASAEMAS